MSLKLRLNEEIKQAMKSQASERLSTLRLLAAAVKQQEVDKRVAVDDSQMLEIVAKQIKQRQDSITQFDKGGRSDLAGKERRELEILREFMPPPLSDVEVDEAINAAISETHAQKISDLGKVVELLKTRLAHRTDFSQLVGKIRQRLTS